MVFVGVEDIDPLSCLYVQDELSVEDASRPPVMSLRAG